MTSYLERRVLDVVLCASYHDCKHLSQVILTASKEFESYEANTHFCPCFSPMTSKCDLDLGGKVIGVALCTSHDGV